MGGRAALGLRLSPRHSLLVNSVAGASCPALKRDLDPLLDDDKAPVRLRAARIEAGSAGARR
jgi:hypothetical protein